MTPTKSLAAVVLVLGCGALSAQPPEYGDPQLQARSNLLVNDEGWNLPPGSSFNSITPSINAGGWVAFPVQVVPIPGQPGQSGVGIWLGRDGDGAIVRRHDEVAGNEAWIGSQVGLNDLGEIAYILHAGGTNYAFWLFDPKNGHSQPVGLLPLTPSSLSNVSLSNSRVLGYQGQFGSGRGFASTAAFALPSDSQVHVFDNSLDPGSAYNFLYSPSMNGQRVIAGKVNVGVGPDFSRAEIRLFPVDGSSTRVVADRNLDPDSPFSAFDNSLAINDQGAVALGVRLFAGSIRAVYRFHGSEAVEIARAGAGPILDIDFFPPAISEDGLVAFRARDAHGQAVYVGDGISLRRVIGNGDSIETDLGAGQLGQHDSSPVFGGAPGMNRFGDVVVAAGLHPAGNNQIEWGTGIIVVPALVDDDRIFADGFEGKN